MALRLQPPVQKTLHLERTDVLYPSDGEDTTITVRQASQGEVEKRGDLYSHMVHEWKGEGHLVTQEFNVATLRRIEAAMTVVESNISDEKDKPLFVKGMKQEDFFKAWNTLPPAVAAEITEKVLEVNPIWGEQGE